MVKYDLIRYEHPTDSYRPVFFWIDEKGIKISPPMSSVQECNHWMADFEKKIEETKSLLNSKSIL